MESKEQNLQQQLNLKNKLNEQTKVKQIHRYREQTDGGQRGGGIRGLVKKGEGIRKYKLVVTKQSWRCEVQHRKYTNITYSNYVWCQVEISGGAL